MALSKYDSTRETTNLARIARIILGPCTGVLQDILRKEITPSAISHSVKTFIANVPAYKKPPINKFQEQLVYGGKYLDFDITLLYFLLRNVCSIPPHTSKWGNDPSPVDRSLSANIERIRIIRNEYYGHIAHFSLSDAYFEQKWKKIFQIVKELESYLGTATDYQDTLKELKTCSMDPDVEKAYTEKLLVVEKLELDVSSLKEEVEEIKKFSDPLESQLDKDIFEQWREDNKFFISTKACEEVERLTKNQNLVIVAGNSGSGKSAIMQHIALKYRSQGWVVKLVSEVKEIPNLYSSVIQNKTLFVLNDPIGKSVLDEIAYSSWEKHEERMKTCLKKVKLLMSCRKYILADDRIRGLLKDQSNIIDISNDWLRLDDNEKQNIFNIHSSGKKLSKNDFFAEIRKIDEYFPLLCKMYFSKDRTHDQTLLTFFKEPTKIVEDEIRSFRKSCKEKYCALVLLAMLNTVPSVNDLRKNQNARKMFKIALELSGMHDNTPPHTIGDALETLNGYFVKKIGDTYQFYHDFVMEVTTFVFGTDYPTDAIKYADISFLRKRVRIKSSHVENDRFTIYVGDEHIDDLGKRLFAELFGKRFLHVVLNPCLKNENIAKVLINELTDNPEKIELLLKKTELLKEEQEIDQARNLYISKLSFLKLKKRLSPLCALVVFCNTHLSLHCLKALKQMQKDITDTSLYFAVCCNGSLDLLHLFPKDQLKGYMTKKWEGFSPIHIVSMFHNFEILLDLIPFGVDVNSSGERNSWTPTMLAAGNDTVENEVNINNSSKTKRNKTIEILLRNGANINLCEETGKSALYIACQNGHDSTVPLLLRNGADINLCDKDGASPIIIACQNGHYSTVQLLLSNGANIDLCFQNGFSPLFIACQNGHDNIGELLLSNGADINLCDKNGTSPLHIACQNGHDSTVELLLNNSADFDLCEKKAASPLSVACKNGHDGIVRSLLSKGASINLCLKNGGTPILLAIEDGHASTVQILLKNGADINSCTDTGCSPLSIACLKGYDTIVQQLLSNRADIDICDKNGSSPLMQACFKGYDSIVQHLLSNGANINLCDKTGYSPLFIACEIGHESTVHLLLSNGADINLCLDNGASPIYSACFKGYESIVELLLSSGADTNLCEETGISPLFIACKKGFDKIACLLLSKGADINLCEKIGGSPLFVACQSEHESIVKLLLSKGADINACLKNGSSPLNVACQIGQKDIVKVLLSNGADTNLCEENGISPLCSACIKGDASIVQLLLSHGSGINLCAENRISPLFLACENEHESIVQLLLFNRADINLCKENGRSPLYRACEEGYENIVQLLLRNGANINACSKTEASPLYIACQNKHNNIVHLLLSNGADINVCLKNGASPLLIACLLGHNTTAKLLLRNGAEINLRNEHGISPLFIACKNEHYITVQLLLNNGADINLCLKNGISPLFVACEEGHSNIVKLLMSKGADINLREKTGASPIHIACDKGHDNIVQLLIMNGADINTCLENGASPLYFACQNGHTYIVQLLLSNGADTNVCLNNGASPFFIARRKGYNNIVQILLRSRSSK